MKKEYYSEHKVRSLTHSIIRDITVDRWKPDYVVGLTRGGLIPAVYISHYLKIPMHPLNVSLRDNANTESNLWMAEDAYGYGGVYNDTPIYDEYKRKNILIVDDINDSGETLNWIINDWQNSCLPSSTHWNNVWSNNVRFAVLVDNLGSNFVKSINYSGEEINKNENPSWIVFPWENWWEL